jgi:hypothetical protein
VKLDLTVRPGPQELVVEVEVHNDFEEDILVLAYPGDLAPPAAHRGRAYVSFSDDGSAVRLSMIPPDAPIGANFGVAVRSLSQLVRTGETFVLTMSVGVPLQVWDPYIEALGDPSRASSSPLDEVTGFIFETEWHRVSDSMMRTPGPGPDTWWSIGSPTHRLVMEAQLPYPVPTDHPKSDRTP